ncbi:hypothetical protein EYF80_028346 [Liparis tanakae]|uniref:Uncharacterized protein n=1 Tax=Liparis tanakae TaxID=230148 RepID=A0A4Z2H6E3_9TELE|nr:hypothetical protein EYF80_028346 [Liparis tanakae]
MSRGDVRSPRMEFHLLHGGSAGSRSEEALTVELPAADMGPPGSVSYPVQTSRQLHDAKPVPVCGRHSSIKEQQPAA